MQHEHLELNGSEALRSPFEREMLSSSFTDLPNASSVGSLNHATLSNCVRRSVVCIPNMSTFRAFRPFVCPSVFACTPVHSNSLTTSTDSLARIAGALTKQLSVLPLSKHVSHTCLTSSSSTRVFHRLCWWKLPRCHGVKGVEFLVEAV